MSNVGERQKILVNSIGAFSQEDDAFQQIKLLIGLGYTFLIILSILQMVVYYLYNGRFHPFSAILRIEQKCKFISTKSPFFYGAPALTLADLKTFLQ